MKVDYEVLEVAFTYQEMGSEQHKIESDLVRLRSILFDWFDNRTHSTIDVPLCSIT